MAYNGKWYGMFFRNDIRTVNRNDITADILNIDKNSYAQN